MILSLEVLTNIYILQLILQSIADMIPSLPDISLINVLKVGLYIRINEIWLDRIWFINIEKLPAFKSNQIKLEILVTSELNPYSKIGLQNSPVLLNAEISHSEVDSNLNNPPKVYAHLKKGNKYIKKLHLAFNRNTITKT